MVMREKRGLRVWETTRDSMLNPRREKTLQMRPRTPGWLFTYTLRVWMLMMSAWGEGFLSVVAGMRSLLVFAGLFFDRMDRIFED
jgi:hypothetical protein